MIVLNERDYAERCLSDKTVGDKPYYTLMVLAKYYYNCFGYRKKKIISLLTDFMDRYYPPYAMNKKSWGDSIDKIAANAGKYPFYEFDEVIITEPELDTIGGVENKSLQRLAFTCLCLAKLGDRKNEHNNGWVNYDEKVIFNQARISCKSLEREIKIGQLADLGLIELPLKNDNMSFRVTFIAPGKTVLRVTDFRELGYQYRQYCGEKFIKCAECGILMRDNKNGTKKYCPNCVGYNPIFYKTVVCVDCGKEFDVNSKNNKTVRCPECQKERDNELNRAASRERMATYRDKNTGDESNGGTA